MSPGRLNDIYIVRPVENMHLNSQCKQNVDSSLHSSGSAVPLNSQQLKTTRSTDNKQQIVYSFYYK